MDKKQQKKQTKNQKELRKKKRRILYGRIFLALIIIGCLFFLGSYLYQIPIKYIMIKGNSFYQDQEIIDFSGLRDYPSNIQNLSFQIKKRIEKNTYIKKATVKKDFKGGVIISVEENYPLFYYQPNNKTVLVDGTEVSSMFDVPIVINYIPNTKYKQFQQKMSEVSKEVLKRISEIKYDPNEVDDGRFLLTMSDGNYVYLTLTRFSVIDRYVEIMSKNEFQGKKGILKLDAGNSFEILE